MNQNGKIYVVGIGPGDMEHMTAKAVKAIEDANIIIGYKPYLQYIEGLTSQKEKISSGMKKEVERCEICLNKALEGNTVALISSGDAGVYGMAGIMLQLIGERKFKIPIEIIPGVTAANAAASILGAPLSHDFAVISLSDLLTDWELIKKRIEFASMGDFVITLYNPKSTGRIHHIKEARDIMLRHKKPNTPVGIVKNAKRSDEHVYITDLESMLDFPIDMLTVVVVGNSSSFIHEEWIITPRGYAL